MLDKTDNVFVQKQTNKQTKAYIVNHKEKTFGHFGTFRKLSINQSFSLFK